MPSLAVPSGHAGCRQNSVPKFFVNPVESCAQRFEDATKPPHAPPTQPWNQVSVAPHTQTPLRATMEPPELGLCVPPCCPTASVIPLALLVRCLGAWLALRSHVLVRTDNTATVAYISRQGGLRSRHMSQLTRHLLLLSQKHLRSLRAIHIPGVPNIAHDELSRQSALLGEWRLHPQVVGSGNVSESLR
ncbi:hypothetical protein PO909_008594 [Leuciscus waleckii]